MAVRPEYARQYYLANKERILARAKARYDPELASEYNKRYRAHRAVEIKAKRSTASHQMMVRLRRHHLTEEAFVTLLKSQEGRCAICGEQVDLGKRLHIDHDHKCCPGKDSCGKCIRGILCHFCNIGIGNLRDSREIVANALAYLSKGENEGT